MRIIYRYFANAAIYFFMFRDDERDYLFIIGVARYGLLGARVMIIARKCCLSCGLIYLGDEITFQGKLAED